MSESSLESALAQRLGALAAQAPAEAAPVATAAVAVILAGPQLELALIRRAVDVRDPWSGHMALPGGRRDPADLDLLSTARRETLEEVGITLAPEESWGALPAVTALSGPNAGSFWVAPFVFRLASKPDFTLNYEVAELIWVPLAELASGRYDSVFALPRQGQLWKLPAWEIDGRVVWGLTHHVLSALLGRPTPRAILQNGG